VTAPAQTITYQLMVTDANGCTSLQPAQVTVTVTPPPEVFAGNDTSVLVGQPVPLNAVDVNNSGFDSYTWSPATGLSNAFVQKPIAYPTESTLYTVVASTADGCTGTASISIKVYEVSDIFVPSGFTPNGDGHNDLLRAIPIGIRDFKYFVVYNRWGQRVFQTADPAIGWDGTLNGQMQGTGTFVWMAAGVDYKGTLIQRKGTTILIR
jgi:gliding motility-associated-like protein